MKTPHWDLVRVKELATLPNGLFVQVGRARAFFSDQKSAIEACRATISALTTRAFAEVSSA